MARVVSVQGQIEVRRAGAGWNVVGLDASLCAGDAVRVREHSRAALLLSNETTLRLDQGTVLTLAPDEGGRATLLDQLRGRLHVITRTPRAFSVKTPFVNANIGGTEFSVQVRDADAVVTVQEGKVLAVNAAGSLQLSSGEQARAARDGAGPRKDVVVRPLDAVSWTMYFPALLEPPPLGAVPANAALAPSIALYRRGQATEALAELEKAAAGTPAPLDWLVYRAGLLLLVGRLDEAKPDIAEALRVEPGHSGAHALLALIAVVEDDKERALRLAGEAVSLDPASAPARLALSYAQQARFELEQALASALEALRLDPSSALAHARRAELEMSNGRLDAALVAAQQAARLNPEHGRTHALLGYASLARLDLGPARSSFEQAIRLDQADPLARLGLGLVKIRSGEVQAGRTEIEIAAILDPRNSLVRSYLGKAYDEERRGRLAAAQLELAKEYDPKDPTPHLYDALRKQAANRPVDALRDLERSIELNGNRAVYRSRLLLDEDAAARSASQARIYADLGFDLLALSEATKSLSKDASNHAAHGFLADHYLGLPRHQMAHDSELLQSQLLQPLNANPVQPRLTSMGLGLFDSSDFTRPGAGEYSELLTVQKMRFSADATAGSRGNYSSSLIAAGLAQSSAFSIGHFAMGSDGWRTNNDRRLVVSNAFVQYAGTPQTSVQAELRRHTDSSGDTAITFFDAANFIDSFRERLVADSIRLGVRHHLAPDSVVLGSYIARRQSDDFELPVFGFRGRSVERSQLLELRHLLQGRGHASTAGFGILDGRQTNTDEIAGLEPSSSESKLHHLNAYLYHTFSVSPALDVTVGLGADAYRDAKTNRRQLDPKLGVLWMPDRRTTVRLAAYRALKRRVVTGQTLEPTGLVGFNQVFSGINDINGTDARLVGAAVTHRLSDALAFGAEWSRRLLGLQAAQIGTTRDLTFAESAFKAHLYWTLSHSAVASLGIEAEVLGAPDSESNPNLLARSRTLAVPLQWRLFAPAGWFAMVRATSIRQSGRFMDATQGGYVTGKDGGVVLDAGLGWRLPNRNGLLAVEVRNALDSQFAFQEINPQASVLARRRVGLVKLHVNF